jgi:predicted ester cyclase
MFPDLAFTLPEPAMVALDGPRAAQVWLMTGTMLGSDPWAGFAPTGKRIEIEGIDIYEFHDGLVSRYRGRYDLAEVARQLGIAPARGSRPERAMAFMQRTSMKLRRKPKSG